MSKLQQNGISNLKIERTVSSTTTEYGSHYGNSYYHAFPALPDAKTLGPKNIKINSKCAAVNAPPKLRSKVEASTVNQVFTISVQDQKTDNSRQFEEGKAKWFYSQITREMGVELEIVTSKKKNLTFLVRGKKVDVLEAKH